MKVPLLDLKPQYRSLKTELDAAVLRVAESQYFILGPDVEKMEKEFCEYLGCKHAFGVSSGTDALLLALMAIGVGPEDEVIVPTYSFFATAGVVTRLNAKPVLVDSDPVTFNLSVDDVKRKITPRTKAIIPVHLYGQSAEMDALMEVAAANKIRVIEDGAQAIGVQYKDGRRVGTIGDIGCFSFFPSKNLGCFGDGGLVTTNEDNLAYMLKIMRVHGGDPKYVHKVIGGNFRIDALQAAVLSVKLPHLHQWHKKRRYNAELYTKLFIERGLATRTGVTAITQSERVLLPKAVFENTGVEDHHIFNQYIIRVNKRDELRTFLTSKEVATEIYYPIPFHLQECFSSLGHKKGDFPISEFCADTSIALPIYPELSDEQMIYVVDMIAEFFAS